MENWQQARVDLHRAARILAGVDDGAVTRDGSGYNRLDTNWGNTLAVTPPEQWGHKMTFMAYEMLRKYRDQLSGAGLNFAAIPVVAEPVEERSVEIAAGFFELRAPYSATMTADLRQCRGRQYRGDKVNYIPADRDGAVWLAAFLNRWPGFRLSDDARQALTNPASLAAPEPKPDDGLPPRRIEIHELGLAIIWTGEKEEWRAIFEKVKLLPGRAWNRSGDNFNTIPLKRESVTALAAVAKEYGFVWSDEAKGAAQDALTRQNDNLVNSLAEDADYDVPGLGGTMMPFQRGGVRYLVENMRAFLADEMGLGKTIQGLAATLALNGFLLVIVCPASLKYNWQREARKWLPGKLAVVLEGSKAYVPKTADIIILNYDILANYADALHALHPKTVIFDESHYLKNYKAQRSQAADDLVNGPAKNDRGYRKPGQYKVPHVFALTGTPVMNRPNEMIQPLKIMRRLDDLGGFKKFAQRYCGWRPGQGMGGAFNLDELNRNLRAEGCFIRRQKSQVLKDLPDKQRTVIPVEITNRAEYDRAEEDTSAWFAEQAINKAEFQAMLADLDAAEREAEIEAARGEAAGRSARAEHLTRIAALKQLAARGKMAAVKEWIADFHDQTGEKLIIFAYHREITRMLAAELGCPSITGETASKDRDTAVQRFQNDPSCTDIVLNIQAGGVGLTLTAASTVIFVELAWRPGDHDQAEDRAHRIGQKNNVQIYYFVGQDTIDEDIYGMVERKRIVVNEATDGGTTIADLRAAITARAQAHRAAKEEKKGRDR